MRDTLTAMANVFPTLRAAVRGVFESERNILDVHVNCVLNFHRLSAGVLGDRDVFDKLGY
jgi:hypothetical protein